MKKTLFIFLLLFVLSCTSREKPYSCKLVEFQDLNTFPLIDITPTSIALTDTTLLNHEKIWISDTLLIIKDAETAEKYHWFYIDTEQGRHHCQKVLKRILRLAGLPEDKNPDNLVMLALRKYAPPIRLAISMQSFKETTVYLFCICQWCVTIKEQ